MHKYNLRYTAERQARHEKELEKRTAETEPYETESTEEQVPDSAHESTEEQVPESSDIYPNSEYSVESPNNNALQKTIRLEGELQYRFEEEKERVSQKTRKINILLVLELLLLCLIIYFRIMRESFLNKECITLNIFVYIVYRTKKMYKKHRNLSSRNIILLNHLLEDLMYVKSNDTEKNIKMLHERWTGMIGIMKDMYLLE